MKDMGKYEFMVSLLNNRNLSINEKNRVLSLVVRDMQAFDHNDTINITSKGKSKEVEEKHKPKDTASFLSLFNDPNGFKFLTHDFGPDSEMNYELLMRQAKESFNKASKKYSIPKTLYALMSAVLNIDGESKGWIDADGKKHVDNYSTEEWVKWANENTNKHLLHNPGFAETIEDFRRTIRLVMPALYDFIEQQKKEHPKLVIQSQYLDKADFYTYVKFLKNGIFRILRDMSAPEHVEKYPEVRIIFEREYNSEFSARIIKIIQINSKASSLDNVIAKFKKGGGGFVEIKKCFYGYCNWSVEALWDGKPKRWNILTDDNKPEVEALDGNNILGFTHVLTYYFKI